MKPSSRQWRLFGLGLAGLLVLVLALGYWVVPAVIKGQLRARYNGRVTFAGWWLGSSSAGVKDLALYEGRGRETAVWAKADKVETDLTLGGALRGRFAPTRITLIRPKIAFRLGEGGELLTRPPVRGGGKPSEVPDVVVRDGRVTIAQEGRPEMVVGPVEASLTTEAGGEMLRAETKDPFWGHWTATGRFDPGFDSGTISLRSEDDLVVTPEKTARIPFVPPAVWEHVDPRGPLKVKLDVTTGPAPRVVTTGDFSGTTLRLPTLGLVAEGATGRMTIDGAVVTLKDVKGRAIGGTVSATGTLDFAKSPPRFDLALNLDGVDVTQTPKSWQLAESGITGRLTGTARLRVALTKEGADLSGSEGQALVENGSIGGVPVKSLKLAMKAEGDDLKYETVGTAAAALPTAFALLMTAIQTPPATTPPAVTPGRPPAATSPTPKDEAPPQAKPAKPAAGGLVLPKAISTDLEFEDVDLVQIIAKAQAMGIPLPFAITGRLSLKAKATIPLGALRDVKAYAFHGQATLKGAVIAGVDLGLVRSRIDLEHGVLDLTDFEGGILDRPAGDVRNPPPTIDPPPPAVPLPPGTFRGRMHAEISPPGRFTASFDGRALPLGELAAPAFPRPTPLAGLVSVGVTAAADMARLTDPLAWSVSGHADAARITYRETTLDMVSSSFDLKDGRAVMPDFAANLGGKPLKANLAVDAHAPYAFQGRLDVADWDLDAVLAFVPTFPRPAPIGGTITASTEAKGTLQPRAVTISGDGKFGQFRAGPVALGDVPIRWRTEGDLVRVAVEQARPFGGTLSVRADVPVAGDRPITGAARFAGLDVAAVSALVPGGGLTMTGRADGQGTFLVRPIPKEGESPIEGNLSLSAPDLTVQGVPARGLQVVLAVKSGELRYDLFAESLGGKIKFTGAVPIAAARRGAASPEVNGSVQAVGFRLEGLWPALGVGGAAARLTGLVAIDANLRTHLTRPDLRARGLAEIRDLSWGKAFPIGVLKGTLTLSPRGWRIDPLSGDVLGGIARGSVVSELPEAGPQHLTFNVEVERASLKRTLAFLPALDGHVEGEGSLRLAGRVAEGIRADGEFVVADSRVYGIPLSDLHAPVEMTYAAEGGRGTLQVRRWRSRFAGGRLSGDGQFGFGVDRSFATDTQLAAIDLESLIRVLTDARRPASGKVSGKIRLTGQDAARLEGYRGKIDLDLDDASLVELPVFRELDRFLGAARGGVFEHGEIHASITNRQVMVDTLALAGRLVQLHATGTIGFDQRLELEMLINTNQIISQTGQALVGLVPGLSDAGGRQSLVLSRFSSFLSNRLLKFRVTGTISSPSVSLDPSLPVGEGAVGFFAGALKLPRELLR